MKTKYLTVIAVAVIAIILGAGATYILTQSAATASITLNGAGATFPYPLIDAMITDYSTKVNPNLKINYQPVGSGAGIGNLQERTVDFAASDAPLTASDTEKAPNTLHIPETIGAVTVAYNLPSVPSGLHLTGQVIADIFQGKITRWNDAAIQNLNPTVTLPDHAIVTVHRSDGSGTTFIFTSYLSLVSMSWHTDVGAGKTVAWPNAPGGTLGQNGNTGVASTVNGTQYSIGYVELAYALQNGMPVAAIQNPAGNWVQPSLETTQLAVESGATGLPAGSASWTNVNLLNAPGGNAYPIVSFTYLLVYKELSVDSDMTQQKATALVEFLWYVVHDGQNLAPSQEYAPLPANVVTLNEATIKSITFNGQTVMTS